MMSPVKLSEEPRIIKVVAAAVQSLIDRTPRRTVGYDEAKDKIELLKFIGFGKAQERRIIGCVIRLYGHPSPGRAPPPGFQGRPNRCSMLTFTRAGKLWRHNSANDREPHDRANEVSQKKAEQIAASSFTFPYPSTKIGDRAIAIAKQIIDDALK